MGNRIRVNGIKLSRELIHIDVLARPAKGEITARLIGSMAENRVNIAFLSYSAMDRRVQGAFCIAAEDAGRLNHILALDPDLQAAVTCISPAGSVSLFPHRFSLELFGRLVHVFGKSGLPLYGTAASLSALTLVTDFHLLERALKLIRPHIRLPPNHSPFGPPGRIKRTQHFGEPGF